VVKSDSKIIRCQFHQCLTYEFFVRTSIRQLFSRYVFALAKNSYEKHTCIMLMKLTAVCFVCLNFIIDSVWNKFRTWLRVVDHISWQVAQLVQILVDEVLVHGRAGERGLEAGRLLAGIAYDGICNWLKKDFN